MLLSDLCLVADGLDINCAFVAFAMLWMKRRAIENGHVKNAGGCTSQTKT